MTTTPLTDVNQKFFDDRLADIEWRKGEPERAAAAAADQMARFTARVGAGSMRDLGGGRFMAVGGYDDGEIFTVQSTEVGEIVLPQHGLDTTTGKVALYSAVPAWHGLGTVIPGGITSVHSVLELAGLDFTVTKVPVEYTRDAKTLTLPDMYVTVRTDTDAGLGVVGRTYTVLQNEDAFAFLAALVDEDVPWESAGALRDGRRTFVSLRLPRSIRIDADGVNDEIVPFIAALNSHDGTTGFTVVATPWRPVCGNTERFAVRDAFTSWTVRHTANIGNQIQEARRTLQMSNAYYDRLTAELEILARAELTLDQARDVVDVMFEPLAVDATAKQATFRAGQVDAVMAVYGDNAEHLGRTAYALERGVTEWLDWHRNIQPGRSFNGDGLAARATMNLEGAMDSTKSKVHRRLLTLATA